MLGDIEAPICNNCSHRKKGEWICAAYPKGIPAEITQSVWDHRQPQLGDHGIQYDPIDLDYELPECLGNAAEIDLSVI